MIYYSNDNTLISGTSVGDDIYGTGSRVTINADAGDDSIKAYGNENVINCDSGNDNLGMTGKYVTVYGGDGNDTVNIWEASTISSSTGTVSFLSHDNVVYSGDGNDILNINGYSHSIYGGAGNDTFYNTGDNVSILGGEGNDSVNSYGQYDFIDCSLGDDYISAGLYNTIYGNTGNDTIYFGDGYADGGMGDDYIEAHGSRQTISGGFSGDDTLKLDNTHDTYDFVEYERDNELIIGFDSNDTLHILAVGILKDSLISGQDLIFKTSSGESSGNITLKDVKGSTIKLKIGGGAVTTLKVEEGTETPAWTISGTTATYGTSSQTLCTITGLKSGTSASNISLSGSTVTLKAAALGTSKVTISGNYKLALASDVETPSEKSESWSISGTKATYQSGGTTAGYTLADDGKSITYSAAIDGETLFTVSGLKSGTSKSNLSLSGKTVTLKAAALGTSKVTISGSYKLALASNVTKTSTKKAAWSYSNSTSTYKSSYKIAGYSLASDGKSISYTKATSATTLAKINGTKSNSGISLSDKKITLKNSSLKSKVTVSGSYEFDFAKDYKNATITGSANADSITARGSKIKINGGAGADSIKSYGSAVTMTGGAGADVFVYGAGTGVISDYQEADKIRILSGKASVRTSGNDAIFTVGKGKITVKGGKKKEITYFDSSGKHTYVYKEKPYTINSKGTAITLSSAYLNETFDVTKYGSAIQAIDASAVVLNLNIKGNKLANKIIGSSQDDTLDGGAGADTLLGGKGSDSLSGGKGDDSIIGGAGSDTLTGGAGSDVFVYNKGDGNDKISDYEEDDIIQIKGDKVSKIKSSGKNVVFTLESSKKITVANASNKVITYSVNGKEKTYIADMSKYITFNKKGTSAKLKSSYPLSSFTPTDYSAYSSSLVTIDASAMQNELQIVGNGKANVIIGGTQDDTINGGAGSDKIKGGDGSDSIFGGKGDDELHGGLGKDTLWGGAGDDKLYGDDGADVFYYRTGEGSDTIFGYEASVDKIILGNGSISNFYPDRNNNVIFNIGDGQLVVSKGADRIVKIVNPSGNIVKNGLYEP